MSYNIVITEKRTITAIAGKEWVKIGEKEVPRDEHYFSRNENEPKTRIEPIMGYSPEIEKQLSQERKLLDQTVDTLDMVSVIKAINGL